MLSRDVFICIKKNSYSIISWADAGTNMNHIAASFDQETAAVIMARMGVAK